MTTQVVTHPETGEPLTHITVVRSFTYDVGLILQQVREDNRMSQDEEVEVTYDEMLDYVLDMAVDDFHLYRGKAKGLIMTDQHGNEL